MQPVGYHSSDQTLGAKNVGHVYLRAGADVADDFAGAQIAHAAAGFQISAFGETVQEPCRKLVTCTCCVHRRDLFHGHIHALAVADQRHTITRAGADNDRANLDSIGDGGF